MPDKPFYASALTAEEDYRTIHAMITYGGSFVEGLGLLLQKADAENFRRLKEAFPEYWKEYTDISKRFPPKDLTRLEDRQ